MKPIHSKSGAPGRRTVRRRLFWPGLGAALALLVGGGASIAQSEWGTSSSPVAVNRQTMELGIPVGMTANATGFYISRDGYLLTNAHAVIACRKISLGSRDAPDREVGASIIGLDTQIDAALLLADEPAPAFLSVYDREPKHGDLAILLTFPGLMKPSEGPSIASARILDPLATNPRLLGLAAKLQPGESGGPVIDSAGRVVAMVVGRQAGGSRDASVVVDGEAIDGFLRYLRVNGSYRDPLAGVPRANYDEDASSVLGLRTKTLNRAAIDAMGSAIVRIKCV